MSWEIYIALFIIWLLSFILLARAVQNKERNKRSKVLTSIGLVVLLVVGFFIQYALLLNYGMKLYQTIFWALVISIMISFLVYRYQRFLHWSNWLGKLFRQPKVPIQNADLSIGVRKATHSFEMDFEWEHEEDLVSTVQKEIYQYPFLALGHKPQIEVRKIEPPRIHVFISFRCTSSQKASDLEQRLRSLHAKMKAM